MNTELKNKLSKTELKIIKLVEKGLSNKSISIKCSISENTVKFHLKNIFKKLDVHNRVEAIYKLNNLLTN
ncbi:MAG: helix-turn-helix transcriptional regulator [Bacteroidales bacterium]|nr:helix-turn-helix transcriptional regulator [Bacteroidales bacterium]